MDRIGEVCFTDFESHPRSRRITYLQLPGPPAIPAEPRSQDTDFARKEPKDNDQGRVSRSLLRFPRGTVALDSIVLEDQSRTYRLALAGLWTGVSGVIEDASRGERFTVLGRKRSSRPDQCIALARSVKAVEDSAAALQQRQDSLALFVASLNIHSPNPPGDSLRSLKSRHDSLAAAREDGDGNTAEIQAQIQLMESDFVSTAKAYFALATQQRTELTARQQDTQNRFKQERDLFRSNAECKAAFGRIGRLIWPTNELTNYCRNLRPILRC